MYTEISFPGLGISLNPSTGFTLGGLTIRWYGVVIALGLCLAVLYACRRSRQFGFQEDDILDGVLWVTPFAILCAIFFPLTVSSKASMSMISRSNTSLLAFFSTLLPERRRTASIRARTSFISKGLVM